MYNCISNILGCLQVFSFFTVYYLLFRLVSAVSQLFCVEETLHLVLCVKQRLVLLLLLLLLLCWLWGRGEWRGTGGWGFFGGVFLCVCSHLHLQEEIICLQPSGKANLLGTVLGPQWEEAREWSSVSWISVLVLSGMVIPELLKC